MAVSHESELRELGLLKVCEADQEMFDADGRYTVPCEEPVLRFGGRCKKHDGSIEMRAEANLIAARTALRHKQLLEEVVLPKAQARVMAILDDEEAKHADLIKIWMTTMDRVGLAAVQGIIVEDISQRRPSMDVLVELLNPNGPAMMAAEASRESAEDDDILDVEVLDESPDET